MGSQALSVLTRLFLSVSVSVSVSLCLSVLPLRRSKGAPDATAQVVEVTTGCLRTTYSCSQHLEVISEPSKNAF